MESTRAAWDQLPDEPAAAYSCFLINLALAMRRTVVATWEHYCKMNAEPEHKIAK